MAAPAFQFQIDGRAAGRVRDTWEEAAQDAVNAGYAIWVSSNEIKLQSTQGAAIARGQKGDF